MIMKNIFNLAIAFSSIWLLSSCEDIIDIGLETGETLISVEGMVSDQPGPHYVKLGTTASYFLNQPTPKLSGLNVSISEISPEGIVNFTEPLQESLGTPGLYLSGNWAGQTNHTYVLDFEWEGQSYRAESLLKRVPSIDSLEVEYKKNDVLFDDGFYIKWFLQEPDGEVPDFYRVKLYANDTLMGSSRNIMLLWDRFVNGNYIKDDIINIGDPYQVKDSARVEVYSLTEDNYYFFVEMQQQINNGGLFANPPANVRTNVKNLNPEGNEAVGFFSACGLNAFEITMPEEIPPTQN